MPLAAGHSFSFYEILGPLGAGGMGGLTLPLDVLRGYCHNAIYSPQAVSQFVFLR